MRCILKDKLFKHFKASVSGKALIYSYMPIFHKFYFFVVYLSLLAVISTGLSIISIASIPMWLVISLPLTVVLILSLIGLSRVMAYKAMKILKRQYSINTNPEQWQTTLSEMQIHLISDYLIENGLYSKWKIEKLLDSYREDEKKKKLPPLVAPGILIAISIPNITQLITRAYTHFNLEENIPEFMKQTDNYPINLNLSLFVVIFLLSAMMVATVAMFNRIKDGIAEIIGNNDGPKRGALIETLNNILYQLKEKSIEEEYIQSPPHRQ